MAARICLSALSLTLFGVICSTYLIVSFKINYCNFFSAPPASVEGRSLCNHRRAYKFFIDSVAPKCLFPAFPCDNYENFLKGECFSCTRIENGTETSVCGNMGYYADRSVGRGQLYLKTREEEPFCAHQYKLQILSSQNELPLRTLGRLEVELESDGGLTEVFTITEYRIEFSFS